MSGTKSTYKGLMTTTMPFVVIVWVSAWWQPCCCASLVKSFGTSAI